MCKRIFKRNILLFLILILICPQYTFGVESEKYKILKPQEGVKLNKSWTVHFSGEIDQASIKKECVRILELESNKTVENEIIVIDSKTLQINPLKEYEQGKTYRITIEQIKGQKGFLMKATSMDFTTESIKQNIASAKIEVGNTVLTPLFARYKRITIVDTTVSKVAKYKVGTEGEVVKIGEPVGMILPEKSNEIVEVFFYGSDMSYMGKGSLDVSAKEELKNFNFKL